MFSFCAVCVCLGNAVCSHVVFFNSVFPSLFMECLSTLFVHYYQCFYSNLLFFLVHTFFVLHFLLSNINCAKQNDG